MQVVVLCQNPDSFLGNFQHVANDFSLEGVNPPPLDLHVFVVVGDASVQCNQLGDSGVLFHGCLYCLVEDAYKVQGRWRLLLSCLLPQASHSLPSAITS